MTDESRSTPHDPIEVGGSVWLRSGDATLGGAARIALLAAIQQTGSITGAAKAVGMSYKAAWDAIDTMNNLAGTALVVRATGGKGGGGTTLTREGAETDRYLSGHRTGASGVSGTRGRGD